MSDPEYQARFETMTKEEQEAELRKYMGNTPPPLTGETAAEKRAKQATNDTATAVNRQNEIAAILRRILGIDGEFTKKKIRSLLLRAVTNRSRATSARLSKVPIIGEGELQPDPAKVKPIKREETALHHARAAPRTSQRTALYAKRKAKYIKMSVRNAFCPHGDAVRAHAPK